MYFQHFLEADRLSAVVAALEVISTEALDGLEIAAGIVGAKRKVVGIELNKPDAIEAMRKAAEGKGIEVRALKTKYPQGGERQMIEALTGRQVVSGKLPMDAGCVVINVSTAAALVGESAANLQSWLLMLGGFDIVFATAGWLSFDFLLEE